MIVIHASLNAQELSLHMIPIEHIVRVTELYGPEYKGYFKLTSGEKIYFFQTLKEINKMYNKALKKRRKS